MKIVYVCLCAAVLSSLTACQSDKANTTKTSTTTTVAADTTKAAKAESAWLVVNAKGKTRLWGKEIELEKLPELLVDTLSKMAVVPNDIPVKYDGEVLMGMRGEVKTVIRETLDKAKLYKVLMSDKAQDMAKNFYVWYMDKLNTTDGYSLIKEKKDAEVLMTGDLLKMLQKADKQEGGLGMDYFLQAQDWGKDWNNVTVLNTKTDGAKAVCTVQLGNGKDGMAAQKLAVTVVDKKAGWRIEKVASAK